MQRAGHRRAAPIAGTGPAIPARKQGWAGPGYPIDAAAAAAAAGRHREPVIGRPGLSAITARPGPYSGTPSSRAMIIRCTSEVPSPISSTLASR